MWKVINKVKKFKGKYRNIISNFSYLSLLQFFNLLVPLITYPYLIRVLGAELYGIVIFAQTVISYFSIFISFAEDSDAVIFLPVNESPVYVNGKLITEQTELKCNDIIALDKMHVFRLYTPFGPKHEEIETVEHTDTKEEILELNEKLKNKDEEITKLQGERDSLQSQIIALNEKLKIKDEELNKLQGERDSLQSTELNKLKEERDSLQNQCTELKQKIKVMVDEMEKGNFLFWK